MIKNRFVQSVGVAALFYLFFKLFAWGMEALVNVIHSFAIWFNYRAVPWAEETAIAIGILYLLLSAVLNSKSDY